MVNWPPGWGPSISSGFKLARAVYRAAVSPAGPEPRITTRWVSCGMIWILPFPAIRAIMPVRLSRNTLVDGNMAGKKSTMARALNPVGDGAGGLTHLESRGPIQIGDVGEKAVARRRPVPPRAERSAPAA